MELDAMYLNPISTLVETDALVDTFLHEMPEPMWKFLGRIDHFVAHKTTLLPHHSFKLAEIAREISRSFAVDKPIHCAQIIGHSATWKRISITEYSRRARERARNAANILVDRLAEVGLTANILEEAKLLGPNGRPRCPRSKSVDLTLYVGDRANGEQLVPNFVHRSDKMARDNRARNRRVEFFAYPAKKKSSNSGKKKQLRPKKTKIGICYRGCRGHRPLLRPLVQRSIRAARKAHNRFESLSAMSSADREKSWNNGREKIWFGSYKRALKKVPFAFVKRTIDRIWYTFRGNPRNAERPCGDRMNHLTIECFDCSGVPSSDAVCFNLNRSNSPGKRWCRALPRGRLKTENSLNDRLFICCDEKETVGFSYFCNKKEALNPTRRKPMSRPHKISLGPAYFKRPNGIDRAQWLAERKLTIVHEVAHLAGAIRLFGERYGEKRAKRLALINPWGARVNADNYANYIMDSIRDELRTATSAQRF
ncbi:MAG: M35 family metallo-endopeptidase [Gammaproteobacteria bacterium]